MRKERSEQELVGMLRKNSVTQNQRMAELRQVAREEKGDQVKETLVNILQQNLELVKSLERMHGGN